jgi:hypothetical protein
MAGSAGRSTGGDGEGTSIGSTVTLREGPGRLARIDKW